MESGTGATLCRPPPRDPGKAPIENILEVTEMSALGPDIFTNTRPPWHPPGARGIFGGAVIAQCLAAAQRTVADDGFVVHSCHCYFLLAGAADVPILLHVERLRDGRSFSTRTVQARQRGRCIFTTTVSFVRIGSGGTAVVRHAVPLPAGVVTPDDGDGGARSGPASHSASGPASGSASRSGSGSAPNSAPSSTPNADDAELERVRTGPFLSRNIELVGARDPRARPDQLKCRQWIRARGRISPDGGRQAHLNALAYMSDSYFIGTVSRVHRLWRFPFAPGDVATLPSDVRARVERLNEFEGLGTVVDDWAARPRLGMLVSLDHSIYFHEPLRVRADEWMFTEMESPWSGDGRGVVVQRIFAKDGTLLASCVQEGVVRLRQDGSEDNARL